MSVQTCTFMHDRWEILLPMSLFASLHVTKEGRIEAQQTHLVRTSTLCFPCSASVFRLYVTSLSGGSGDCEPFTLWKRDSAITKMNRKKKND